jgi:hypothetical protein
LDRLDRLDNGAWLQAKICVQPFVCFFFRLDRLDKCLFYRASERWPGA